MASKKQKTDHGPPPALSARFSYAWNHWEEVVERVPGKEPAYTYRCKVDVSGKPCGAMRSWAGSVGTLVNHLKQEHSIYDPALPPPSIGAAETDLSRFFNPKKSPEELVVSFIVRDLQPLSAVEGMLPPLCPRRMPLRISHTEINMLY